MANPLPGSYDYDVQNNSPFARLRSLQDDRRKQDLVSGAFRQAKVADDYQKRTGKVLVPDGNGFYEGVAPVRSLETPPPVGADGVRGPDFQNVTNGAPPAAPVGADGVRGPDFQNVSSDPRKGDPNTFTGRNGVTRQVQAAPAVGPIQRNLSPIVVATNSYAPDVRATTQRTLDAQRGNTLDTRADAASFLNPMSNDAEIMRRLEISQGYGSNKGSPQARRLEGEAIAGQLGARNAASSVGQVSANRTLEQGAQTEAAANEAYASRRDDASKFSVDSDQRNAVIAAQSRKPSQLVRGLDGSTRVLDEGGELTTLRDENGQPLQTPPPAAAGQVTERDVFNARQAEISAVQKNEALSAEERQAAIAAIAARPEYAAQSGGGGGQGGFAEGATYTDAKGNKARYVNGKFVPVEK